MTEVDEFRAMYERHVGYVVDGDIASALAEIDPDVLSTVMEGVTVPGKGVRGVAVRSVGVDGETAVGEAVYQTDGGPIGLRSHWARKDGRWLAVRLENVDAQ